MNDIIFNIVFKIIELSYMAFFYLLTILSNLKQLFYVITMYVIIKIVIFQKKNCHFSKKKIAEGNFFKQNVIHFTL